MLPASVLFQPKSVSKGTTLKRQRILKHFFSRVEIEHINVIFGAWLLSRSESDYSEEFDKESINFLQCYFGVCNWNAITVQELTRKFPSLVSQHEGDLESLAHKHAGEILSFWQSAKGLWC